MLMQIPVLNLEKLNFWREDWNFLSNLVQSWKWERANNYSKIAYWVLYYEINIINANYPLKKIIEYLINFLEILMKNYKIWWEFRTIRKWVLKGVPF